MTIKDLSSLLNWKLLKGGHEFPGPDGGTCINEAAIVVAGFEYRQIDRASDCPPCFSRPIAAYALGLNDRMPGNLRQELLMPFVVRLAGTTDSTEIECKRTDTVVIRTVNDILPVVLRLRGLKDHALFCERAGTCAEAYAAADIARDALRVSAAAAADAFAAAAAADSAARAFATSAAAFAAFAAAAAAFAARAYAATAAVHAKRNIWIKATHILDSALKIGRQAEPIEASLIFKRAATAKLAARDLSLMRA